MKQTDIRKKLKQNTKQDRVASVAPSHINIYCESIEANANI